MRVLIIPSWYQKKGNEARGSFFREQAFALKKMGIDVVIAYVDLQGVREISLKNAYRIQCKDDQGIPTYIYTLPSLGSMHRGKWFETYCSAYRKLLNRVLKEEKPFDLIHAHSFIPAGYVVARLKNLHKLPIVLTEHYSEIQSRKLSEEKQKYLQYAVDNADGVICVSKALKAAVTETCNYSKHIYVISNIVSSMFQPMKTEVGITDKYDKFRFVSVGGLSPGKRHNLTIKAFHKAFNADQPIQLRIIGSGEKKQELLDLVKTLDEEKRILVLGQKSRSDVVKEYQQSDAFVLASALETFGVSYIEAMACGLPTIGTRNGGYDQIFDKDCGYIVEVDDENQLIQAFQSLYYEYKRFNKEYISKSTNERFGEVSVCEKIIDVYKNTIDRRPVG